MEAKQWALLAGVGALLIAKNPRIPVLLAEVAEGVALRQAQQREAQKQAAFLAKRPIIEIPVFKPLQLEDSVTPLRHTLPLWMNPRAGCWITPR